MSWQELDSVGKPLTDEQKKDFERQYMEIRAAFTRLFGTVDGKAVLEQIRRWAEDPGFMPSPQVCKDGHMMSLLQNHRLGEYNLYRRIISTINQGS